MIVYADTSFLFSLYVPDSNSAAAAAAMQQSKPPLYTTQFGEFEFVNALNWRVFRKELSASQERAVLALLAKDVQGSLVHVAPLTTATLTRARQLARSRTRLLGTRALDVLHVASALILRAGAFYTFDQRQAKLAAVEGLRLL